MKVRRELWFGFTLMGLILLSILVLTPWWDLKQGHLGLLMLALIVVCIMLGFPTAFTLMGMGVSSHGSRTVASTPTSRRSRCSISWCSALTA